MADIVADAITAVDTVLTAASLSATIHTRHNVANMTLDAITVGSESHTPVDGGLGDDYVVNHEIVLSVRVHTAYVDQAFDDASTVALCDAVVTALKSNVSLTATYRLMGFTVPIFRSEFADSASKGAQIDVTLHTVQAYPQE